MLRFRKLPLLVLFLSVLLPALGLKCYRCRYWEHSGGQGDPSCLSSPKEADLWDLKSDKDRHGKDYYCVTEVMTLNGHKEILRHYVSSEKNFTAEVDEGPVEGTDNPEKNYIRIYFCKTDGCNVQQHTPPPTVPSGIKCFVCEDKNDPTCNKELSDEYLVPADPIPSWARAAYKGFAGHNKNERVAFNSTAPMGEFEYKAYCRTTTRISSAGEGISVSRGVSWFRKREGEKDGKCERESTAVENCYCNDKNGCNNRLFSSSVGIQKSGLFWLTLLGLIFPVLLPREH